MIGPGVGLAGLSLLLYALLLCWGLGTQMHDAFFGSVKTGCVVKKGFLVERSGGVFLLLDLVGFLI